MGRTAEDLGCIFRMADSNGHKLEYHVWEHSTCSTSWGNVQRRYKQHLAELDETSEQAGAALAETPDARAAARAERRA
jgi:hypothetical protein